MSDASLQPDVSSSRLDLSSAERLEWMEYGSNGVRVYFNVSEIATIMGCQDPSLVAIQEKIARLLVVDDEERDAFILARRMAKEGVLEFDDSARVSLGDDNGAYVESQSWVSFDGTPLDRDLEDVADDDVDTPHERPMP